MSIGSKLKVLIDYNGTNVNKLAKTIKVSPQTIYGIIKRDNTKVDIDILQALAYELNVTLDYFATGHMDTLSIEEEQIRSSYKELDDHGKEMLKAVIDLELKRVRGEKEALSMDIIS